MTTVLKPNLTGQNAANSISAVAIACSGLGHVRRGNETWARTVAEALCAAGEPVQLLGGGPLPDIRCPYRQIWNVPRDWFGWRRLLSWGRRYAYEQQSFARMLAWQFRGRAPEIVHTADPVLAYRLGKSARSLNYQVVYKDGLLLGPNWCKQFDWVQVLAPYYLEQAVAAGIDTRRWFVIPHMVRLDRFQPCADRPAARQRLLGSNIPADALVVLAVGDFSPESNKRLDWIVQEIARHGPAADIHLVLCGQATPRQEQQMRSASADLGGRLHLFPNVAPERMPDFFQAADVFAHAALREPFGIVLIEALASGLPVIGHRYPVTQWIIGDGGAAIDMTASGELASVLMHWKENSHQRLELSRAARDRAVVGFSPERIVPLYQELYASIRRASPG
jgi:1,2-diacylglycerol 3-alpha-glucosyltransferase